MSGLAHSFSFRYIMATDMKIVNIMLENVEFYVDAVDRTEIYAEYRKDDSRVYFQRIDSADFASCLRIWYSRYARDNSKPSVEEIRTYIRDDQNYFGEFQEVQPYTRVAGSLATGIEYNLADRNNTVIEIRNGQWQVATKPTYRFLTSSSQLPQVMPKKTDKTLLELLAPLVNLNGDDLILFALWLAQAFCGGAHYGLMLTAQRGSSKSTMTKLVNRLLDPSRSSAMQLQRKLSDFLDVLSDNYLCCFDNLRSIPVEHSDAMAAAITGSTVAKRVLYTTRDISYVHLLNVIVLNGVHLFPSESDLAERFLLFELKKISADRLKSDTELETLFANSRGEILGAIFDLLAKAMKLIKEPVLVKPTRMAKCYYDLLAIARAMGLSEQKFDAIIKANVVSMQRACSATPLVQAVVEYMDGPAFGKRKVIEKSSDFYKKVVANYSGTRSSLPGSASEFSKRLKSEHDGLAAAGFSSIVDDTGSVSSTITIIRDKK